MAKHGPLPARARLGVVTAAGTIEVLKGNPQHRAAAKLERRPVVAVEAPAEPDWNRWFPGRMAEKARREANTRCRDRARSTWRTIVREHEGRGVLAPIDESVLADYCVCAARVEELELEVSKRGELIEGVNATLKKNPALTMAMQYRSHMAKLARMLWIGADARDGAGGSADDDDGDDPFD